MMANKDVNRTFGERVKARRIELGLSQDAVAKSAGYKSRSSINKIELGERDVSQTVAVQIANALMTTVSYLMGSTDEPEARPSVPDLTPLKRIPILGPSACGQPV